ncbi:NmrA family NAD(P)-binding protein [Fastidiosibacter lacustris]|uniref:NmrA family NAD(P)-binding protein n=1 Tax=Fastidiosibacter lacustris TaxID=2056695 RepID=UPI001300244E|nr:NmrA family NAD(P)-binding protein [Fastidiosibacter lacustris]
MKKVIALVGGTGHVGKLIAESLLGNPNVQLRLLVRPDSRQKVKALEERGAQIIEGEIGVGNEDALASLCQGAMTVISAVQGGPDIIIDGQKQLLIAARKAGVKRFIPSDFSLNLFKVTPGHIITSDWRLTFSDIADKERGNIEVVHILNGGFLDSGIMFDFLRLIDVKESVAYVWGDGKQNMDWTTYVDAAQYTAEVAIDERPVPRAFKVAGNVLNFHEIVKLYEEASGDKLKIVQLGSMADLDLRIEELLKGGQQNFLSFLPLMYYRSLLNGEAKLDLLMNDRYPSIKPTTMREYIQKYVNIEKQTNESR